MKKQGAELNPNRYVIVYAWLPTNYGKEISYPDAIWRRTFAANDHAHIGHAAIKICHDGRVQYVSLYPTESHFFTTSPAINHTLEADIKDQENLPPTLQATLFSLDTEKMLAAYDSFHPKNTLVFDWV